MALAAVFAAGVGAIATSASANSLIQITVPGPLRGRVMSVWTTVWAGTTPSGSGLTGGVGGLFGVPVELVVDGGVVLAAEAVAAATILRGWARAGGDRRGEAARRVLARVRPARRLTRRPTDAGAADSTRPENGSRQAQTRDLIATQAGATTQLALADHG